ncbi:asparagine--tRNA ligase, cytoplasmic 1-like [Chenopodium quinoa]|uniref:asparagine--tRNA ligase n=1 Tax=Chenopodium quinoa TaxID=63459 RepID=A0A803ML22_CHEQI|nr:asparagine--tRNA ligase, cytoplasmic 1-like [Chenopodium quinoa]
MADDSTPPPPTSEMSKTIISDTPTSSLPLARFSKRVPIANILSRPDGGASLAGQTVIVGGWVRTGRMQGHNTFAFLEITDGSCSANLQVMVDASVYDLTRLVHTGTSVSLSGTLKTPPEGTRQKIELKVDKVLELGPADPATYPLPKTRLTLEFLRDRLHLRPRTNLISAVSRIRNELAYATHVFLQEHGFLYLHTPIITTSDCEGAGEMFQVTTLINEAERVEKELKENPPPSEADIEAAKLVVQEKGDAVKKLKEDKASKEKIKAAVTVLSKAKEDLAKLEERANLKPGLPQKDGKIDYSQDFFARQAFLTVSGQLQAESFACALGSVYTFGPTFRAENSHTSRHLAEFWMLEPEMAFADLEDDMNLAEAYVQFVSQRLLDKCLDDMELMVKFVDKTAIDRLKMVASTPFVRITYTDAVKKLQEVTDKKFENKVEWGIDLATEHERYLSEVLFKKPVIVYDYPKDIKAFYMRLNDDGKTVAAMDVLVPKVGELVGGSQREERYDVLCKRIVDMGLPLETYEWYLDLRRYGTVKHCGFGLGFERLILFATGIDNIRDVIPFPRYPGRADL